MGRVQPPNYRVAYEETQSNRVSDFHDFVCSLFRKRESLLRCCLSLFVCSPLDVIGRIEVSSYISIVHVIFYFLLDHWAHPVFFFFFFFFFF